MEKKAAVLAVLGLPILFGCPGPKAGGKGHPRSVRRKTHGASSPKTAPGEPVALREEFGKLPKASEPGPWMRLLERELEASRRGIKGDKSCPAPYFLGYQATVSTSFAVTATLGELSGVSEVRGGYVGVELRVGSHRFDQTHFLDRIWAGVAGETTAVSPEDISVRTALWKATDRAYRSACQAYSAVKAKHETAPKEERVSDDFSVDKPVQYLARPKKFSLDRAHWKDVVSRLSGLFRGHPHIEQSGVQFRMTVANSYMVTSEGGRIQLPESSFRLVVSAGLHADDGMSLECVLSYVGREGKHIPSFARLERETRQLITDLEALRRAPVAEPYEGPAIFKGKAAAVFFHEVLGHRLEGHRQKLRRSGQTFALKVGKRIMPSFLSLYDDPLLTSINKTPLNGFYPVDDEGIAARRALLVDKGVLRGFLMSRIPIPGLSHSNGHGRRAGLTIAIPRQANLVLKPERGVPFSELRKMLVDEARRQGKKYGLLFTDVSGGFTFTNRRMPQAFKVMPVMVYRVFVDGRPDELIRGVDLVGTPLLTLTRIVAAGNDFETFNGMCGAESGWVPVSATAPSLLFSKVETQKKPVGRFRPPILPSPSVSARPGKGGSK